MKKKVIAVLLVLVLVAGAVSAKEVGVKVGAELGWGFDIVKLTDSGKVALSDKTGTITNKYKNNGFSATITAEYALSEYFSVKGSFGLMFAGQTKQTVKAGDKAATDSTFDKKAGTYIDAALDAKYTVKLSDDLSLSALAGIEMLSGYIYKTEYEDLNKDYKNFSFGLNVAPELSYAINKNVSLTLGCNLAWFFVNNAKLLESSENSLTIQGYSLASAKRSATSFFIRPYVGCTYAF